MTVIGNLGPMRSEFWMVYGEGQGAPTYKHDSLKAASEEAERLAGRHPGIAFYVLKAKSGVVAQPPAPKVWKLRKLAGDASLHPDDDLPF